LRQAGGIYQRFVPQRSFCEPAQLRALVVEDEAIIRMMVVEMLEELGHTVAAEAGHLDKAMDLASSIDFDIAILDEISAAN
jgi:CheY-like chemotaxis protein